MSFGSDPLGACALGDGRHVYRRLSLMVTWRDGLAALVVVVVGTIIGHFLFGSTFAKGVVPAVGAAVAYVLLSVAMRRRRREPQ